jgi:hypothetical protein
VRSDVATQVQKIARTSVGKTYIASNSWNLLGGMAVTIVQGREVGQDSAGPEGAHGAVEAPGYVPVLPAPTF